MLPLEKEKAQTDLVNALQAQTQGDMANLMARYGTRLALGGSAQAGASPLAMMK